ncbi:MAG: hypothetical protein FGM58_09265 [Acidimicrobiia bacterium]|nr:hypothetical protein [Acidimicrobiia bacterium]
MTPDDFPPVPVARGEHEPHDDLDDFGGIDRDLPRFVDRRRALWLVSGGLGAVALAACGSTTARSTVTTVTTMLNGSTTTLADGSDVGSAGSCTKIPTETAGPYPADGTNGPDVLTQSGVVRRDITTSFGSMSGSVSGVPLTMRFKVLDIARGCVPYAGAAMYAWHASPDGKYSLYSAGATNQNWLRGVQQADADGWVTFTTVFPGCYDGRWPHVHFEVYPTLAKATSARNAVSTSQLALPQDACAAVYGTSGYGTSATNLQRTSLTRDMVFRDGWQTQLGTVTGDATSGMTVTLNVPV